NQYESYRDPSESVELYGRLKAWSHQVDCGTMDVVGDLAEIHAAAREIINSIELLTAVPPPTAAESGKILVNLNAWINEELVDHIGSLKTTLADVISRLYEVRSSGANP